MRKLFLLFFVATVALVSCNATEETTQQTPQVEKTREAATKSSFPTDRGTYSK